MEPTLIDTFPMNSTELASYFDEGRIEEFAKSYPDFDFNQPISNMPASKTYFQQYAVSKPYDGEMIPAIRYMLDHGANIDAPMNVAGHNTTLLMYCLTKQNLLLAKVLIDHNASLIAPYGDGTIIHYLAQTAGLNYLHESVEKSLKRNSVDLAQIKDKFGNTPLMTGLRSGNHVDTNIYVPTLIEHSSDIRAINSYGENALHIASGYKYAPSLHVERLIAKVQKDFPESLDDFLNQESKQGHCPLDFALAVNPPAFISLISHHAKTGSNPNVTALKDKDLPENVIEGLTNVDAMKLEKICIDIEKIQQEVLGKPYFPTSLKVKTDKTGMEKLEYHIPKEEDLLEEYTRTSLQKEDPKKPDEISKDQKALLEFLKSLTNKDQGNTKIFEYFLDLALKDGFRVTDRALLTAAHQYTAYPDIIKKMVQAGGNPAPKEFVFGTYSGMSVLTKVALNAVFAEKKKSKTDVLKELKTFQDMGFEWQLKDKPSEPQNVYYVYLIKNKAPEKKDLQFFFDIGAPVPNDILFHLIKHSVLNEEALSPVLDFFKDKIDLNQKDKEGMSLLDRTTQMSPVKAGVLWSNALLKAGADPLSDPDFTPLSACFVSRNRDLAQRWGTKLNVSNSLVGALMWEGNERTEELKQRRLKSICEIIEDFQAEQMYDVDGQGVSPLMAAVFTNNVGAVQSLLAIGVDPRKVPSVENEGEVYTVLDVAYDNEVDSMIVNMLKGTFAPTSREQVLYDETKEPTVPSRRFSSSELFDKALAQSREDGMNWVERKTEKKVDANTGLSPKNKQGKSIKP